MNATRASALVSDLTFVLDDGTYHHIPGVRRVEVSDEQYDRPSGAIVVTIDGDDVSLSSGNLRVGCTLGELFGLLAAAHDVRKMGE